MRRTANLINATFLSLMIAGGLFAQIQDNALTKKNVKINGRFKASISEAVHELANEGIPIGFEAREHSDIDTDSRKSLSVTECDRPIFTALLKNSFTQ